MPHLQFDINREIPNATKVALAERVRLLFAEVMHTGTDHVSISIRECGTYNLSIGRMRDPHQGVALVNADLRQGRRPEQRRRLALGVIHLLQELLNIPAEQVYITFTEHPGADFHLAERVLADWQENEDPLA